MLARKIVPVMLILVVVCVGLILGPRTQAMVSEDTAGASYTAQEQTRDVQTEAVAGNGWGVTPTGSNAGNQPNYKPGEIIVKFKKPVADTMAQQLAGKTPSKNLKLTKSLDNLNSKHKVKSIEPMFKNFKSNREQMKNLLKKNPKMLSSQEKRALKRIQRAPKSAKVPELDRIYKVKLEDGQSAVGAVKQFSSDPDVEYAELNYVVSAFVTEPNDSNYSPEQWALNNTGQSHPIFGFSSCGVTASGTNDADIDAPEAWDITTGSSDVIVAVVDTGVDYSHRDLKNNMWADANGNHGYDFVNNDNDPMDDHGHGTHCAGIIAAEGNNGLDIAGVCWTAKIMAVKMMNDMGSGTIDDASDGIYYAVENGADIISNSWGEPAFVQTLKESIDYAFSQGVFVVASAGNSNWSLPSYPAYFDNVMSVAATDHNDAKASFSNYGKIDVAAPGVDILSLRGANCKFKYISYPTTRLYPCNDGNATMIMLSGTSMAGPHVAGLAALCLSENPALSVPDLWRLIINGADDLGSAGWDPYFGAGRINAYNTLSYAASGITAPGKATTPYPADSGTNISVNASLGWQPDVWATSQLVYIGTNFNDVNDANTSSDEFKGEVWLPEFNPNTLSASTTYYWRIDEKNSTETTKGDVWSFITGPNSIIYVDTDASGSNDGTSWEDAFTDLQDAVEKAFDGDEIWVAEGTYKPTSTSDRNISFALREGVTLRGGFAGMETDVNQRDPNTAVNVVTLSGDIGTIGDNNDNTCHILTVTGKHAGTTAVDRFTVANGNALVAPDLEAYGGGILIRSTDTVTIEDCTFADNNAVGWGGGICDGDSSSLMLSNCTFSDNMSLAGGALACTAIESIVISGCVFEDNGVFCQGAGGAVFIYYNISAALSDCTLTNNTADNGIGWPGIGSVRRGIGGGIYNNNTILDIENCEFTNNNALSYAYSGGAILNTLGDMTANGCTFNGNGYVAVSSTGTTSISKCSFIENYKGCLFINVPAGTIGTIDNCTFANTDGWGIYSEYSPGSVNVNNCLFYGNKHSTWPVSSNEGGGGISIHGSTGGSLLNIVNCTFAYNDANYGGALFNGSTTIYCPASPNIINCLFWGNTASEAGSQIYNSVMGDGVAEPNISYSDIQGSGGSGAGWDTNLGNDLGGNIDADPCFVDADNNDFHLGIHSPCIDKGDPNGDYNDLNDIDGEMRKFGTRVDMGADEALWPNGHWWKLDETSGVTAYDSVDTNNGIFNGNDPCWTDNGVDLNGVSDYFSVLDLNTAYTSSSRFTVAGWFKTSQSTGIQTIVGSWAQWTHWIYANFYQYHYAGWQVLVENNKVKARIASGSPGTPSDITGASNVNVGEWHHFALVYQYPTVDPNMKAVLYVNGVQDATPAAYAFTTSYTKFRIGDGSYAIPYNGVYPTMKGGPFCGTIDDVMIFNRALTAAEVYQLYLAGQ